MKKNDTVENNAEMINVYLPEHHQNIPARTTESVDDINYKFNLLNGKKPKDFIAMVPFRQPDLSEVKSIVFDRNPQKPEKEEETYHKKTLDELGQEKLEQSLNRVGGKKRGKNYVAPFFKGAGSALYNIGATIHSGLKYMSEDAGVAIFNAIHDADVDLTAEQQRSIRQYWQTQEEIREKLGLKLGKYDSQFSGDLGGGIASMVVALMSSAAYKSPNAAAMVFGMSKTGDVYARLREKGVSAGEALPVATGAGVVEGGIERIGLPIFLRTYGSSILKRKGNAIKAILKQGKIEFLQEGSQSLAGNFLMAPYEEGYQWQEWVDQAMYEGVLAAITAPVAGAATYGMTGELRAKYADIYREKLGLDEQQSKNLAELTVLDRDEALDVITEIADNETIATLFNDNAVNDAEQTLKEGQDLLDKLLAQKALGLSDEVQAKADEYSEKIKQQALASGEKEDVADAIADSAMTVVHNIAQNRIDEGLATNIDEAVSGVIVDVNGSGKKRIDDNYQEVAADAFELTDPGYDPVEDYMTPEQRQNEIDEERIATMVEDGGMSVEEATFRVKTGREPTELDKALEYDFIQYQLSPKAYGADGKADIDTPEFKRWSGSVDVVAPSAARNYDFQTGKPVVVEGFHGSGIKNIAVFDNKDVKTKSEGRGFYFTDRKDSAATYGNEIYNVYLSMRNPFVVDYKNKFYYQLVEADGITFSGKDTGYSATSVPSITEVVQYAQANGYDGVVVKNVVDSGNLAKLGHTANMERRKELSKLPEDELYSLFKEVDGTDLPIERARSGFGLNKRDFKEYMAGIIEQAEREKNISTFAQTDYIVFSPNQIKSVYNRGTFDSSNDNIYYQTGELLTERENGYKIADDNETVQTVVIPDNALPEFKTRADLRNWLIGKFNEIGNVTIKSTGANVEFNKTGAQRAIKNARQKKNNIAYPEIEKVVSGAKYSGFREADKRHQNVKGQDVYHSGVVYKGIPYSVEFYVDVPLSGNTGDNFAGNKIREIKIAPTETRVTSENQNRPANNLSDAIYKISLAVLRGKVNPARYDNSNNIFYQIQEYDDLKSTNTVSDVKKLLKGLKSNEEVRLMFDKKKRYWFAIDANDYIHNDMITKAYKQGLYPEFNSEYDARQYFDENYMADDEYLIRFKAESYSSKDDLQNILQDKLNQDEYKVAYSLGDENGKGYVVFARSLYDLSETPLKTIGKDAEVWSRNPYMMTEIKKLSVEDLAQEGIFYQTADGELNLEVTPVRRTTAGQSRQNRMIYHVMGQYEPTKKLITLFEGRDTTTLTHELLHHYLPIYLTDLERAGRFDKLEGLYKELGVSRMADMRREEWEKLVDMGTSYIFYNQAPNEASKSIFERAKQWMMDAYNTVKRFVKPSPEVTKFFDELFARDASTLPDVSDLKGRSAELAKILQGAKNGQELTVNGLSLRDISRLRQALYARIPAAGKTLADEIRAAGGIDTESELARQLGYDSRKGTEGGFWNYKGEIKDESRLIDFLKANGYLEEVSEKSYEETSSVWDKVQQLIDQRNDTYNEKERSRQMARDSALAAGQVVSEILDQHYIGDVKKLEGDLRAVTKMLADRGAAAVDKATLDYLTFSLKQMEKDYQRLLYQKKEERYNYQEKLTKFIKDLPLDYNHKSKFMDKIRMVKDEKSFNKYLKETKERAEKYIEQEQRRMLSDLIQSEVKSSRPRKVMAQKYDYENNVLFKDLRDYNKMTQGEAAAVLKKLDDGEKGADEPGSRGYLLRRLFLEYKSNGMDSSPELMRQLYEMIGEAKQLGRESKEESEFKKSFEREQNRQQIIDRLESAKADKNKWTTKATNVYRRGITNLYSMLNSIAGREIADKYEMETVIDRKEQREWKHLKKTSAKAEVIYKVKSYGDLLNVMADKGQEVAVLYRRQKDDTQEAQTESYNENFKYDVSVLDIIDIYNAIKNKKTREDYEKAYGADQINHLISLLSPEDRAFGDMLMEDVNSRFSELNKVYVRTYGMDLKKVDNYWMGSAEHIKPVDIVNDFRQQSTTPGFFKERTAGTVTPVAKNAWIKYQKHISQSYYMTDVAEKYKQLADIFKSTEIQNLIENHYGSGVYNALTKQIENIGLNAQSPRLDDVSGYFQKLLNNWVGAKVSVNPVVFVGQLTSFTNYAEGVNLSAFIKNIGYALAHPIEVKDFMMKYNGDFLQHRYEAGFNEAMSRFIDGAKETNGKKFGLSAKAKFNYSNALSSFVRIGDLGAIIYGGYGQFKTLLDSGMSVEEARRKFEFSTLRSQQSGNAASISDWQQQRGFPRIYLAFKNASLQYTRKIADTVIMLQNGDISREEAAKVLTNYLLIQPAFWVIAKNIAKSLLGLGDDDDEFDDGVLEQLLVNPIDGVPFVSDMVRYAYREAAGEKNYSLFSTPLLDDVEKSFRKIGKEDKDFYDFADIVTPFIEMLTSAPAGTAKRYVKIYNEKWGE